MLRSWRRRSPVWHAVKKAAGPKPCFYMESSFILAPGAQITLLSDGVVEAANAKRELFGFERTRVISDKPAAEIARAAKAFGQNNDITVVTVKRLRP